VTSKAEVFAKEIIINTTFATLFQTVSGCEINGERSGKHELISYTLNKLGLQPSEQVLMIGDRFHDIRGAKIAGISSAGVLYGYGSYEELSNEKPSLLINTPEELLTSLS
jgi:phosphoglycolate phosphatase